MDEKKKLVVLAALAVMVLGIGAFQFMPKGEEPAPVAKKELPDFLKENDAAAQGELPPLNPLVASKLAARDPFLAPLAMQVSTNVQPPVNTTLKEPTRRTNGYSVANVRPVGLGSFGDLPPNGTSLTAEPEKPEEPEAPFGYTVGGVVVGARPAVVFKDAAGNQRLVMQGGDVDGESTLKAVRMDHVVVVYKGKTLRLKVGGETVAK